MRQNPPPGLRPNCLLTRYPICFVHGLKNIFIARDYWHGIPEYLSSHGYDTRELFGPWRGPHQRRLSSFADQFRKILEKYEKLHVIAHSLGTIDMLELLMWAEFKNKFASVTFVSPPFGGTPFAELGLIFGKNLFASTNLLTPGQVAPVIKNFSKPEGVLIGSIVSRPRNYPICSRLKIQHSLLTKYLRRRGLNEENDGLVPLDSQLIAKSLGEIFLEFPGDHNQVIGRGPWPSHVKTAHSVYLDHAIFLAEYDFKTAQ